MIGVRIQVAAWLEKIGNFRNSIEVLETLLEDCKKWVELMEKSVKDGLVDASGKLKGAATTKPKPSKDSDESSAEEVEPENLWAKRTRVMGKSVGISVKLGELYACDYVLEGDAAGKHLIWAVETVLKELQRRQVEGLKEGEGDWMSPEQIGGALEGKYLRLGLPSRWVHVCLNPKVVFTDKTHSVGESLRVPVPALSCGAFIFAGGDTFTTE